jgi:protocatechuate 3,4-dioxygenase beta subunit
MPDAPSDTALSARPAPARTGGELFTEARSAEVVAASFAGTSDPRLRQVLTSLVHHLHAFVKDVELTEEEWGAAIAFLTRTGQMCDDVRQEFILLSDVLGVSMLVETINHRAGGTSTESTVLGPFHMVESPPRELGDNIALDGKGEPCLFTADDDGRFWFRTIVPRYYPIPDDGPVGELLAATGRHPNRPAHVHFIVTAPGHRPVTTHLFVDGDPYIESDAVFGVKESLIRQFPVVDDPARAAEVGLPNPFRTVHFDVALLRADEAPPAAQPAQVQPTVVKGAPS